MATGYDPKRSKVNADRLQQFIQNEVTGDLTEVPGIGPAAQKALAAPKKDDEIPIGNTYQLLGRYLMLKGNSADGEVIDSMTHNDTFWYWLRDMGISAHRSGIVQAIAKKVNTHYSGMYNPADYEDSDDEDDDDDE